MAANQRRRAILAGLLLAFLTPSHAQEGELTVGGGSDYIPISADKPYLHVVHGSRSIKVQRVQDPDYELKGYFAKTIRKCPPFCIRPMTVDTGVETIGEVEIFDFMESELRDGTGIMIDARTPAWHNKGTIPGSINVPFTVLKREPSDPEFEENLEKFGAKRRGEIGFFTKLLEDWGIIDAKYKTEKWDFTNARELVLWCNGPACGQSPRAIEGLLAGGYPADKLHYYRGGMQMWQLWGLTTVVPDQP